MLLDADGVLQHAAHDWEQALTRVGGTRFPEVVFDLERAAMRGEVLMRDVLIAAAQQTGVRIDVDDVLALWTRFDVDDSALGLVDELRQDGYRCYLATNQQDVRVTPMRERYGDRLDGYFFSCDVGAAKPSQEFFERVLESLDVLPSECAFFDDSPGNVRSAKRLGIHAAVVGGGA